MDESDGHGSFARGGGNALNRSVPYITGNE